MTTEADSRRIEEAVRARLSPAEGSKLTGLRPLGDGHSSETYLLEGTGLVLRTAPRTDGLMPFYDIPAQYEVMRAVAAAPAAPPVPAVRDLCTDESAIGRPFFLMEWLPGGSTDWSAPGWMEAGGPALREQLSASWIEALSAIHRLDPAPIPAPRRSPADEALLWLHHAERVDAEAELIAVLRELAENPPAVTGPPTVVHGDPKFANFLWQDGRLTAVLDWELTSIGEPLADLGYILGLMPAYPGEPGQAPFYSLPGWWGREWMVAAWEEATGRDASGVDRYERLGMAKIGTILAAGVDLWRRGLSRDPRLERWDRSLRVWLGLIGGRTSGEGAAAPTGGER